MVALSVLADCNVYCDGGFIVLFGTARGRDMRWVMSAQRGEEHSGDLIIGAGGVLNKLSSAPAWLSTPC